MARLPLTTARVSKTRSNPVKTKTVSKPKCSVQPPKPAKQTDQAWKKSNVQRAQPLKKSVPSPLAIRMQQDLQLAGMSERTQESYLRAVRKLAVFARKSPELIDEEELRAYFYYIRNDQLWEASSIRVAYSGIKFFYKHTCPRDWQTLKFLRVEEVSKLPAVLSIGHPPAGLHPDCRCATHAPKAAAKMPELWRPPAAARFYTRRVLWL